MNDTSDTNTISFINLLTSNGLQQHVQSSTHKSGNIIDLIISPSMSTTYQIQQPWVDYFISDHAFINTSINILKAKVTCKTLAYPNYKAIDDEKFTEDLVSVCNSILSSDQNMASAYNSQLRDLLDIHAPIVTKRRSVRDFAPWFDHTAHEIKCERRRLERKWRRSKNTNDLQNFSSSKTAFRNYITSKKSEYINAKIRECGKDSKRLYREVASLLDNKQQNPLPSDKSDDCLAEEFASFFVNKIAGCQATPIFLYFPIF
jgi:hypothetical protein